MPPKFRPAPARSGPVAPRRRVLIATNHLERVSGSEVVALETVEHFVAAGCEVSVFANWAAAPMAAIIEAACGAPILTDPTGVRPFAYDLVYAQHQVLGLFDYQAHGDDREATTIVTGRLSRRAYLESGGWLHDRVLVDVVLANSTLTAQHLKRVGQRGPIIAFLNAAPAAFFRPFTPKPASPGRILVVSNHADPALMAAIERLRLSAEVEHLGRSGGQVARVTPAMIAGADLVISIGKTIPYALAARVPVYVYDHFGGPGYLDAANRDRAALFNFTGRCSERTLTGEQIADEVLSHYADGVAFARDTPDAWLRRFHLPDYLDPLLATPTVSNARKRRRMGRHPFLIQERMLADHVRQTYRKDQQGRRRSRRAPSG